jgi:hypothetical protein
MRVRKSARRGHYLLDFRGSEEQTLSLTTDQVERLTEDLIQTADLEVTTAPEGD